MRVYIWMRFGAVSHWSLANQTTWLQWEEYMKRRKAKEGVVKDLAGNIIEDAKPTYQVQVCSSLLLQTFGVVPLLAIDSFT
jgi:hypothetical protein